VYSINTLIAVAFTALAGGLIIGFLVSAKRSASKKSQQELEAHLNEMQHQQELYQHEVTAHFPQTAELLDQLTTSYRDVHNHLAKGAQLLANPSAGDALKSLPDDQAEEEMPSADQLNPPLDYAPKSESDEGVLSESFGIKKTAKSEEAPKDAPAVGGL